MSASVCVSVCPQGYLPNHTRDLCQIFLHVAYGRARSSSGKVTRLKRAVLLGGGVISIDNILHSIAFATHTKATEPTEMLFAVI